MGCGSEIKKIGREVDPTKWFTPFIVAKEGFRLYRDNILIPVRDFILEDVFRLPSKEDLAAGANTLDKSTGLLLNTSSNAAKIPVVFGVRRMGGIRAFVGVAGENNKYLYILLAVCEGEIQGFGTVYIEDIAHDDPIYKNLIQVTKYNGTAAQAADSELMSNFTDWTADHRLRGVAYLVCRFEYNSEVFSSFPRITVDVFGRKLFDPRDNLFKYSKNPALAIYAILGDEKWGKQILDAEIDIDSIKSAADYCDQTMIEYQGSANSIAYYECNGAIDTESSIIENLKTLLSCCNGHLPRIGGKYKLIIEKNDNPVFNFNVDNILEGSWSIASTPKTVRLNRIKTAFLSPEKNWQPDFVIVDEPTYLAADGGVLLEQEVNLNLETSQYRSKWRAETLIKKSRQGIAVGFAANLKALNVCVGDVVTITHPTPGWTNKLFRVIKCTLQKTGIISFSLLEHEPTVYDRTVPPSAPTPPDTNLPDPNNVRPPSSLQASSGDDELFLSSGGDIVTRVKLTWTPSITIFVTHYEIQYQKNGDENWYSSTPVIGKDANTAFISNDLDDGFTYNFRVRAISARRIASDWVMIGHTVLGKQAPPPDVDNFLASEQADGTREFTFSISNPPLDLAGYEIRYTTQGLSEDWNNLSPLHSGLVTQSPFETNLLLAGAYFFAIKAVDTSRNYSNNPKIIETNLGDPRLGNSIDLIDFKKLNWPGTISNGCRDPFSNELYAADNNDWDDLANTQWEAWKKYANNAKSPLIYLHPVIDIGVATNFSPIISVLSSGGTRLVEISHSTNGTTYTPYAVANGAEIYARYLSIRITITKNNSSDYPAINAASVNLSAKVLLQVIEDLNTASLTGAHRIAVGHVKLPLTKAFASIKGVTVTLQNVGPGWSFELISKTDLTNGPEIKIYNGSANLADAVVDAQIRGV